jgi:hypothetical protein
MEDESGYAQIEVEAFPVQATASTKDFDHTDIAGLYPPETRYQLHRQGDRVLPEMSGRDARTIVPPCTGLCAGGADSVQTAPKSVLCRWSL